MEINSSLLNNMLFEKEKNIAKHAEWKINYYKVKSSYPC
jgi:hypothetical protein